MSLSDLKAASIIATQNTSDGIRIVVSVTDTANNQKQWSCYLSDVEAQLWGTDPKAIISLVFSRAADSLAADVAYANRPKPVTIAAPSVSLQDAVTYMPTAQAALAAAELAALTPPVEVIGPPSPPIFIPPLP